MRAGGARTGVVGPGPVATVSDFGGRPIHWNLQAGDGPTVVLANGCGLAREHWAPVVRLLAGRRVVTFDRPGMGGTPWPGRVPTLAEEVASLADLVTATGAPAVVVGHSMASFHAEALARLHPGLVAGLVMVDGSVEFLARAPRPASAWAGRAVRALARWAPAGEVGVLVHRLGAAWQSRLSAGHDWDPRFAQLYRDPEALAMGAVEAAAYWDQAWDLLGVRAHHALPPVPTLVLTAYAAPESRDWLRRQHRYAELLGAQQVVVEDSHHLMMIDDPGVVATAVASVSARTAPAT